MTVKISRITHIDNLTKRPSMTIGRAAVLGLIERYVSTGFGYRLSLLEVQKLVYFLTAAGEPLNKAVFKKHHYGPYADVLRHVLDKMEGHFITRARSRTFFNQSLGFI